MNPVELLEFYTKKTIKPILQSEKAECGLACLAMIATNHGYNISIAELRERYPIDSRGGSLNELIKIATSLGFVSRPLRVELENLGHLELPCILHWDMKHFVVLTKVTTKSVYIINPAHGEQVLTLDEMSNHFTGVCLELEKSASFKKRNSGESLTIIEMVKNLDGIWGAGLKLLLVSLLIELTVLIAPQHLRIILDQSIPSRDYDLIRLLGLVFLCVLIIRVVSESVRKWMILWIGSSMNINWTSSVFKHLQSLPIDYFKKRNIGDITSRFEAIHQIQETISTSFIVAILDGLLAILILILLYNYNQDMTFIIVSFAALYVFVNYNYFNAYQNLNLQGTNLEATQQTKLIESIRTVQPVKLFNRSHSRITQYVNSTADLLNMRVKTQKVELIFDAVNTLVSGGHKLAILWLGSIYVLDRSISVGVFVVFAIYADLFLSRFMKFFDFLIRYRMLDIQIERLSDIVKSNPEKYVDSFRKHNVSNSTIEFKNVSFSYSKSQQLILNDITFRVDQGEIVAITGPSGSGKSTIAKLFLGLYDVDKGKIAIDSVDIYELGKSKVRDLVGCVFQDDQLINGSILDNISFFDEDSTLDRVMEAAMKANIHEEINTMNMGYYTPVGEVGDTLSGGQKQRILIARALYRCPQILVLGKLRISPAI